MNYAWIYCIIPKLIKVARRGPEKARGLSVLFRTPPTGPGG